jgi:hypothetical protein
MLFGRRLRISIPLAGAWEEMENLECERSTKYIAIRGETKISAAEQRLQVNAERDEKLKDT